MIVNSSSTVIHKNEAKISKFCIVQVTFFSFKFVLSFELASASITLSQIKAESIILAKYLPFLQPCLAGFQT